LETSLRDFIRLNYMTGAEVARQIGVRDMTVYSWLQGESRPSKTGANHGLPKVNTGGIWLRRHTKRVPISRIQKLARYPKAPALPVL
jgi:hypothetical protein